MMSQNEFNIRTATSRDYQPLNAFFNSDVVHHRHFDWRPAIDWLERQPFFILERRQKIIAAIACPEDPDHIAWIRFFYVSCDYQPDAAFDLLIQSTREFYHRSNNSVLLASLSSQEWYSDILLNHSFECNQQIVVLEWYDHEIPTTTEVAGMTFHRLSISDLHLVQKIDSLAFKPLWQISQDSLITAMNLNAYAVIAELDHQVVGYQISNFGQNSVHLSRLAVLPAFQHRSIGMSLLADLKHETRRRGINHITVNTQEDNIASISLYRKAGFTVTNDRYPVFISRE